MSFASIWPTLLTLLLTGLAGSVGHCLGMCGPLVILAGARYPRQGIGAAPYHLLYHTGRILVYGGLGLAAGGIGAAAGKAAGAARIPGILSLAIGLAIITAGLNYLGWLPFWRAAPHSGWWQRAMSRVMKAPGRRGVFLAGMLNGLLPCGLVYEALLIAAASRSPLIGALGMLVFGLATIPALLVLGVGAAMLSIPVRRTLIWIGGVFVVLVGLQLALRGVASLFGVLPDMLLAGMFYC